MELPVSPLCDVEPGGRRGFVGTDVLLNTKLQAIKNPKEFNFAWGFSVLVVPRDGIEPPTRGFSIPCSTDP